MIKKLAGLSFLAIAILSGCKKPDSSVGIGNLPDEDMMSLVTIDTLTVEMVTVREDSLKTDELSSAVLGKVFHPRIGTVNASFATQLRLDYPNIDFGLNPVADSIFLKLKYTGDAFGTFTPHQIMVRQLEDTLVLDSAYYSNFDPLTAHGSLVDPLQPPVSLKPTGQIITSTDTVFSELVITMDMEFAQGLLDLDTSVYSSNDSWLQHFPGIVVSSMSGYGACGIDISSGSSVMRLHYHNDVDTNFFDYEISPLSARVNMFSHEFVPNLEDVNSLNPEEAFIPGEDLLYIMSGSGVKIKLDIPYLESLNDSLSSERAILKAELIVPLDEHYYDSRYPAHEQLFVLVEDEEGNFVSTPDQAGGIGIDGTFDRSAKEYKFNISRTVQHILNRSTGIGYGNFSPEEDVPPLYIVSSRAGIAIQGVVLKGTAVDENRARLVLTCAH